MLNASVSRRAETSLMASVPPPRASRPLASEMIYAAADGDLASIQRLFALGVRLDVTDYDGRTPLHLAAAEGHEKLVRFFIEHGIELAPADRWGRSPGQDAQRHGHWRICQMLDSQTANSKGPPRAARRGEVGVFRCIE